MAELFAADKGGTGAEKSSEPLIGDALGIEMPEEVQAAPTPAAQAHSDERIERVPRLADERGSGHQPLQ